ncbi:MAG: NAD(P)/FAD-dependent oxidoreductase [Clostridiales bacterium]|nr:NAD(P)/FAD-dependent oxidoreductase [Clostridiales bacterium]
MVTGMGKREFDLIIIGGGPAGISTALYAVRGGLDVAVIHSGDSALHRAEHIQNYYGSGELSGTELYDRGIKQAEKLGITVISGQVTFVTTDGSSFTVEMPSGALHSSRLVVATGSTRKRANIKGLSDFEGKGVSYCAVCDAFFYRKKRVGVIGAGEFAKHEYAALEKVAGEVYLLTDGETPTFQAAHVMPQKISRVFGRDDGRVGGVEFVDGETLELDGLFVALGVMGSNSLAKSVGVFTDGDGAIVTDGDGRTNVNGLYAAGDCTAGVKQISKAVDDGMRVGLFIVKDFKRGDKR